MRLQNCALCKEENPAVRPVSVHDHKFAVRTAGPNYFVTEHNFVHGARIKKKNSSFYQGRLPPKMFAEKKNTALAAQLSWQSSVQRAKSGLSGRNFIFLLIELLV